MNRNLFPKPGRGLRRARRHPVPRRVRFQPLAQFTIAAWMFFAIGVFGVMRSAGDSPMPQLQREVQQLQAADIARSDSTLARGGDGNGSSPDQVVQALEGGDSSQGGTIEDGETNELGEPAETTDGETEGEADPGDEDEDRSTALGVSQRDEPVPISRMHVVQEGETVSGIAYQYGVTTDDIVWNNAGILDDADMLLVGATLQVPGASGVIHAVRYGETVSEIALRYDAEIDDIIEFESNGFEGDANNLIDGAMILVPGGRVIPPEPESVQLPDWIQNYQSPQAPGQAPPQGGGGQGQPVQEPEPQPQAPSGQPQAPVQEPEPPAVEPPPPPPPSWTWPATGRITSRFGPRHPLGIDISMVVDTPIHAAMSGQVVFAGGNACCSYGYHMIVRHDDGHETLYAHLSKFEVSNGDWVQAGQLIGRSGNTGYSTGPHLHFEIRQSGVHRDPMLYLP